MIEWTAFILSVIGIILNAKKNSYCWIFWIISCLLWIPHSFIIKEWAMLVTWITFLFADIYGWYSWRKDKL